MNSEWTIRVVFVGVLTLGVQGLSDIAKLGVLVVDGTTGNPIPNVSMTGVFHKNNGWLGFKGAPEPDMDEVVTDANGRCKVWGRTNTGKVSCIIDSAPHGYYFKSKGAGYLFSHKNIFGVWEPDNVVVTIRLQRVERPIPLFVKNARSEVVRGVFPEGVDTISYDLMMGDWLPPIGEGEVADVEFTRNPRRILGEIEVLAYDGRVKREAYRDSIVVKFKGNENGLTEIQQPLGPELRIRTAPEDGYSPEYVCWEGREKTYAAGGWGLRHESNYEDKRCFCFRIRTRRDDKGRLVEAYYGKIYRDFHIGYERQRATKIETIGFFYYLNPQPLDRNLEWDMKSNLCPNPGEMGNIGDRDP